MMRITFVLPSLDRSGGNRMVAMHAHGLRQRGHHVTVVVPQPQRKAIGLGDRFRALLSSSRGPSTESHASLDSPAPSHLDELGIKPTLGKHSGRVEASDVPDADVIIATWWETAEWVLDLPQSKGAKAYFVQHYEVFPYTPKDRVDATYRAPLHRIAVAQWLVDKLRSDFHDAHVDLVPNAVDQARFHAAPRERQERPTVGVMFASTPFKGFSVAREALRHVSAQMPNLLIRSFGDEHWSAELGFNAEIKFSRSPPQEQIRQTYAACDVWLTASHSEGFNLPSLEAMACRTPVVGTRTGWPAEAIVDGLNGYVCDVGDSDALADRLLRVLTLSNDAWCAMSNAAHATAAPLRWERSWSLFEQALVRATSRSAKR